MTTIYGFQNTYRVTILLVLLGATACWGAAEGQAEPGVMTNYSILVGFPSGEDAASSGVLLVTGTVIPLSEAASDDDREAVVERSLSFASALQKLWNTFRLDPGRQIKKGMYVAATVDSPKELPILADANIRITATLLGFSDSLATYRVVFVQGSKTIADSTVSVTRGGRAVVGGMDGAAAPYLFVFIEPEEAAAGSDRPVRFAEGTGITEPEALHKAPVTYPEEARKQKLSGVVVAEAVIDKQGLVVDVKVLETPDKLLSEAAVASIRQWRFKPARDAEGKEISVLYVLTIKFCLN